MSAEDHLKEYFIKDFLGDFLFSEAPKMVRCKKNLIDEVQMDERVKSRWLTYQKAFLKRIQDRILINKEYIERY
ncbi:MAG TPA: hypothetical protein PLR20_11370 [Syntrophales bacterium]|jgi:hypothetical protein|nr:hypothetical protein [Syntrophales bacterium]HOX93644.1 hypothetical protein [Syntrophales bacterium]HPI57394.1 hypothetical protein [Syntrophales bacterium]HPN25458.1 hypothetical protein [Syntrophales bacterium]HQM29940.1 hypothetical protein [Syntrophales bacterium]